MKSVGTRFLLPLGLLGIIFSIFILYRTFQESQNHINELVNKQAALIKEYNLAIRGYAGDKIRPVLESLVDENEFIPETMSTSYISRSIFERVREKFPDYIIRFSSENPRNPINKAGPDELRTMEYFRINPQIHEKTEEIQIGGRRYMAYFTARWIKPECLRCHGDPKDAPTAILKQYGAKVSFNRKAGEIAGLDTVAIPIDALTDALTSDMIKRSLALIGGFVLLFISVMFIFRFVVTRRLAAMAKHFDEIAAHPESPQMTPLQVTGNDEISVVGNAFNKLVEQLRTVHSSLEIRVNLRTSELTQANEHLKREAEDRRRAEAILRESEERYRISIEYSNDGVTLIEGDRHLYVNQKFLHIFGYDKAEDILGEELFLIAHPDDREIVREYNRKMLKGEPVPAKYEFRGMRKDGTTLYIEVSAAKITYQGEAASIAYLRDISERKSMEEQLQTMSLTDELTGLYNRRGFITLSEQQLKIAARTKKDMILFFADLDKLKQINDTLGHHVGDNALIEVATILKEAFRESDIIARMGGDEFAVLAIETTDETRETLINRLHNLLEQCNKSEGRNYQLSLSIGLANYIPETPSTLNELIAEADRLMYEEKKGKTG